ncbi:MAG: hypothetical protein LBU58_10585 [Clostridiales bacterium]|jgi:predicted kinase|nr:hypothetical protein [Clostridiales bacterium]
MKNAMIVVSGYLAAGKTTFALKLSQTLGVPCFCKDLVKIALGEHISIANREDSKRLSRATVEVMLHIADNCLRTNTPLILEGNFRIADADEISTLCRKYDCSALTFLFVGNSEILHRRFVSRESTSERHPVNRDFGPPISRMEYDDYVKELRDIKIPGETQIVDTTDFESVNYERLISKAGAFLGRDIRLA